MHQSIIDQLDAEIAKLQQAREMLSTHHKLATTTKAHSRPKAKQTRRLSPEARKRIAEAQKRRWAAARKAKKAAAQG